MSLMLEKLDLTAEQLAAARHRIEQQAYFKWLEAGRPIGRDAEFWQAAEFDWIEHEYVPNRPLDGTRFELRN